MLNKKSLKHCFLYVVLLLCAFFSNAQENKIDKLLEELKADVPDTTRLRIYTRLSSAYTPIDPEKKFFYANKYRLLAGKMGVDSLVAHGYLDMGTSHGMRNHLDSALFYFSKGYEKAKQSNYKSGMARSLANIGYAYDRSDNKEGAIKNYRKALEIYNKIKNNKGINQCYVNIGSLYFDMGHFKLSESYFKKALEKYQQAGDQRGVAHSLFTLGNSYKGLKQYKQARDYYLKSLKMSESLGNPGIVALSRWGLGQLDVIEKNYKEALVHLEAALKINREIQNNYHKDAVLFSIAEAYIGMKEFDKAETYVMEAYTDARKNNSKVMLAEALPLIVEIKKHQRQFEKALDYQSHYLGVIDSLESEKTSKNVMIADFDRVRSENENLEKDNTKIAAKNTNYVKAIFITSLLLLFVVLLLALYYKRNQEKKAINELLQSQKEEIASINIELEALNKEVIAQNSELEQLNRVKNKFFSIVSHDLRNPLSTLKMLFGLYRKGELDEEELNKLLSRFENTIYNTAVFLDNLLEWSKSQLEGIVVNAKIFDIKQLIDENISLLDSQIKIKELKIENKIDKPVTVFADPNMINVVVRNLISNAVKFCNPNDLIEIKAQSKEEKVIVCIRDTGPGIAEKDLGKLFNLEHTISTSNTGEKGHQIGLVLCKDMIEQNNGSIRVESAIGEGTVFCIELPKG